jgi:hypothetical protein
MIKGLLIISALAPFILPAAYKSMEVKTYGLSDWRLVVRTDGFTRRITCSLRNGFGLFSTASAGNNGWKFKVPTTTDPNEVWFSVDDGQPTRLSDVRSSLVHQGKLNVAEELEGDNGYIELPFNVAAKALTVRLQLKPFTHQLKFRLGDGNSMLASAKALGCQFPAVDLNGSDESRVSSLQHRGEGRSLKQ